jgi:hypothetical protein
MDVGDWIATYIEMIWLNFAHRGGLQARRLTGCPFENQQLEQRYLSAFATLNPLKWMV